MRTSHLKLLFCLLAVCSAACGDGGEPEVVREGLPAPEFALKSLDGSTVESGSLKGDVVVLNFWATYCQPCRSEIPELNQIAEKSGAKVVGIALDADDAGTVRQFEREVNLKFNYSVLFGNEEVFRRYNGIGIPYTLVLDRAQRVVRIYRGPVDRMTLEKDLADINRST